MIYMHQNSLTFQDTPNKNHLIFLLIIIMLEIDFDFLDGLSYHCNLIEDKVQVEKVGIQIMHFVGSGIRNGKN